jgi:MoxR-like ATPase
MKSTDTARALIDGAEKVIHGKRDFLELLCVGILAKGHILIEDNPGLGKTTAAKTIAALIGTGGNGGGQLVFKRIQFTPDLLPYDITGVDVFDPDTRSFRFVKGPVFANIVLADEINRTTPKVQSALLEVMGERQISIGNTTHILSEPFFVIATENPIETEGTFPLPAAELDRFMMQLNLGYPDRDVEVSILQTNPGENVLGALTPAITLDDFLAAQNDVKNIYCHAALVEAIVDICRATREHSSIALGASPRAGLQLLAASRALALIRGREFVTDEDVNTLASPVLSHRIQARSHNSAQARIAIENIIKELSFEKLSRIKTI